MNKWKPYKLLALILLTVFAGGQISLLTHHHELIKCCGHNSDHALIKGYHEKKPDIKCELCDAILDHGLLLQPLTQLTYYPVESSGGYSTCLIVYSDYNKRANSRGPPSL